MARFSTENFYRFPQATKMDLTFGGVEANVAAALSSMGVSSRHITRFPDNEIAKAAEAHFVKLGVDTGYFQWGGDRLGIYYLEQGIGCRSGKVLFDRMGSAFCGIKKGMFDWQSILKEATWFHFSGINPALSQGSADACIEALEVCKKNNSTVSIDINYRKNLWQYGKTASEVMPELISCADIVIASVYDMADQFGIPITNKTPFESFQNSALELSKKFPTIKKIVTTYREVANASENTISSFLYENGKTIVSKNCKISTMVDRIGTGDAFAAGLIYGVMQKWTNDYTCLLYTSPSPRD